MMSAADSLERVRPFAALLVACESRKRGSKMSAYTAVASAIGVSESWVRRLLGRRHVVVEHHHAFNLAQAYARLCERIEAERDLERDRFLALRETADAIAEGPHGLVASPASPDRRGTAS